MASIQIQRTETFDGRIVFTAWEPSTITGEHSTITTIGGVWYGQIGTNPDRATYEHLPVGDARSQAVNAAYEAKRREAVAAIMAQSSEARERGVEDPNWPEVVIFTRR